MQEDIDGFARLLVTCCGTSSLIGYSETLVTLGIGDVVDRGDRAVPDADRRGSPSPWGKAPPLRVAPLCHGPVRGLPPRTGPQK